MILLFYVVLNGMAVFLFAKMKKRLHILETMVNWMFASYEFQNFSALNYMNFKTIVISERLSNEFAHVLNRIVLYPLLMVAFLHLYNLLGRRLTRLLLTIGFILFFMGLEWLSDYLGILNHVHWRLWWSFAYWLAALLLLLGFMKIFQKILFKEGLNA